MPTPLLDNMKTKKSYSLPNGKYTTSPEVYCRAWKSLYAPVAKYLNLQVIGCNPGVHFAYGHWSFQLPTELVKEIKTLIHNANTTV